MEHKEKQLLIRRYKAGYKDTPEDLREIKAMEDVYADALKEEFFAASGKDKID